MKFGSRHILSSWIILNISFNPFGDFVKFIKKEGKILLRFNSYFCCCRNYIDIYTDGSKYFNSILYAFIFSANFFSYSFVSVFTANLLSIQKSRIHISCRHHHHHQSFTIYVDFKSSFHAMQSKSQSNSIVTFYYKFSKTKNYDCFAGQQVRWIYFGMIMQMWQIGKLHHLEL